MAKQPIVDFSQYKWVFTTPEKELFEELSKILVANDYKVSLLDNMFIYGEGTIPALLVAHLDTVHKTAITDILYDETIRIAWSPQGLGADDRAGVCAILHIISEGYKPHVLFTCGEETGGKGASAAIKQLDKPDVRFMVELDRKGSDDMVFYSCENKTFERFCGSHGFKKDHGSFTDISTLMPAWGIAGVNLSVGYYNQHSTMEHLKFNELDQTIRRVIGMLRNMPKHKFVYVPKTYTYTKNVRTLDDDSLYGADGWYYSSRGTAGTAGAHPPYDPRYDIWKWPYRYDAESKGYLYYYTPTKTWHTRVEAEEIINDLRAGKTPKPDSNVIDFNDAKRLRELSARNVSENVREYLRNNVDAIASVTPEQLSVFSGTGSWTSWAKWMYENKGDIAKLVQLYHNFLLYDIATLAFEIEKIETLLKIGEERLMDTLDQTFSDAPDPDKVPVVIL